MPTYYNKIVVDNKTTKQELLGYVLCKDGKLVFAPKEGEELEIDIHNPSKFIDILAEQTLLGE